MAHPTFDEARALYRDIKGRAVEYGRDPDDIGGFDLSGYPVDGPLPDIPETTGGKSRQQLLIDLRIAGARGHQQVVGTPQSVADPVRQGAGKGPAMRDRATAASMARRRAAGPGPISFPLIADSRPGLLMNGRGGLIIARGPTRAPPIPPPPCLTDR